MEQKTNYSIKVDGLKLQGAFMRNLVGKTATKRCLIIPIEDNPNIFLGEKGCYLNFTAVEVSNPQFGDTHCIRADLPKEVYERMTDEQRRAVPILGNMRPIRPAQMQVQGTMSMDGFGGGQDDFPF